MKRRLAVLLAGLISLLGAGASSRAQVSFSAGIVINSPTDFTQPLTPLGTWVTLGSYGRVWRPGQVAIGWRPYSFGRWEWTDLGWYWVSDEPWAWAVYHYGSWVYDPNYGWCWVPGTEWAPAWVSWRDSTDYVGWAPLGPSGVIFAPSQFVFVQIGRFNRPIRPNVIIVNNQTVINRTRVVSVNVRHETREFNGTRKQVVVNVGPQKDVIAKATGARFTPRPVKEVARETPVPEDVKRSGDIERPVLKEQDVKQWRQRARDEGELEKQPPPTGRERPGTTPQPQPPESEQKKPEQQKPEQQKPESQKPEPQKPKPRPERPAPAPQKPDQVRPEQSTPTPPQQPPPTGRDQPRPPQGQQTRPPSTPAPTPDQSRPERPAPAPQKPDQARPDQSTPTPPQQPPPTGRDQPRPPQGQQTRPPATPTPDQTRPERPAPAPQKPDQARPDQSTPTPPQGPPAPTGRDQPRPPQEQQTKPPTAPTPDQSRPDSNRREQPQARDRQASPPASSQQQPQRNPDKDNPQ